MVNAVLTPSMIAKETVMQAENGMVLGNLVHTDYSKEFAKVGEKVSIRKPIMVEGQKDNLDITGFNNDIIEGSTSVTMNKTFSVPWEFDSKELTLSIEEYSKRYIKPAVNKMKDDVELEVSKLYKDVYNFTGTPGTTPTTFLELGAGGVILTNSGVPTDERYAVHDPNTALKLADGLKGVYNQGKAKTAFEEAKIGRYAKFDNYESVHAMRHTVGNHGGVPLVNGAAQNVTYTTVKDTNTQTLITDGWTLSAAILTYGDVFTIAGVYAVNPISKQTTGELQRFVVKVAATADGAGNASLSISPAIIASGAYQNVDVAPADNAAITVVTGTAGATYAQSMLFHKNAFALVTRPLAVPDGTVWSSTQTGNKMSISVIKSFDFKTRKEMIRLDMLYGLVVLNPAFAARLTG